MSRDSSALYLEVKSGELTYGVSVTLSNNKKIPYKKIVDSFDVKEIQALYPLPCDDIRIITPEYYDDNYSENAELVLDEN